DLGGSLDKRDRADDAAGQVLLACPLKVRSEDRWNRIPGAAPADDAQSEHLWVGEEALEIAVPGGRRVGERAVERRPGGVPQGELRPRREVGEIDQEVGAFGRGEDESLRRDSHRREEQPALAADLCEPLVVGLALAS